jgi:hypothetical protein
MFKAEELKVRSRLKNRLIVPNQHFLRGSELFDIRELNLLAMHTVIFNAIIEFLTFGFVS